MFFQLFQFYDIDLNNPLKMYCNRSALPDCQLAEQVAQRSRHDGGLRFRHLGVVERINALFLEDLLGAVINYDAIAVESDTQFIIGPLVAGRDHWTYSVQRCRFFWGLKTLRQLSESEFFCIISIEHLEMRCQVEQSTGDSNMRETMQWMKPAEERIFNVFACVTDKLTTNAESKKHLLKVIFKC